MLSGAGNTYLLPVFIIANHTVHLITIHFAVTSANTFMKNTLAILFIFFALACKENKPTVAVNLTTGQMPCVVTDLNNHIHIVYGNGDSIMYTESANGGQSFNAPVCVDTLNHLVDFATRGPQIAVTKNGVTIVALNREGDIFSYSKDAPGKWTKGARVNDVDSICKEGFIGLGSDGNQNLFAAWLDLRGNRRNKIYGASSADGGKTWKANQLLYASPDSSVCECCKVSVAMKDQHVYVMFRNWLNGNRDLYVMESTNAGQTFGAPQKLGKNNWPLEGCPMDGGGLSVNSSPVQTAWRRHDSIFSAVPGKEELFIAKGKNPSVTTVDNHQLYAWVKSDTIFYQLNGSQEQVAGKGNLPSVQMINNHDAICVWTSDRDINYLLIKL